MEKLKEVLGKLDNKTKKYLIAGAVGIVAFAIIVVMALNNKTYEVLFTGVSSEEAKQIIGKLQEDGVEYQYNGNDILVPSDVLDVTKANLVSEDYPKSGFTYNVFKDNVSMMTTDADRRAFKIYDLETRIGSTIQIFEGVKEAYVTIALGEAQKYALTEKEVQEASAQAVVVMKDGGSPTQEQAKSIQRLISRSIPGMVIDNVSVFDGNGREITVNAEESTGAAGKEGEEIAQVIENQITAKIQYLLGAIYGNGNVKIAVKCKVNMEQLLKESITYSTPEKVDENDKKGITSEEELFSEYSGSGAVASGVAGADSNADIPVYNVGDEGADGYGSNNISRQYLVNQIKEQGQVSPGVVEDISISVAVNGKTLGDMAMNDVRSLVGGAAGIAREEQAEKITIVAAPFYTMEAPNAPVGSGAGKAGLPRMYYIVLSVAGGILLLTMILMIIVGMRKKKLKKAMVMQPSVASSRQLQAEVPEIDEEIISINNERGIELRKKIRDFTDQNPEISAQLLKSWLNGGGKDDA